MSTSMEIFNALTSKLEKFTGQNFLCWQQQIKFWLTELRLISVILGNTEKSSEKSSESVGGTPTSGDSTSTSKTASTEKYILCHGRSLSALSVNIYSSFCHTKSAIELWNALDHRYGTEERGLKRCSIETWLDYQMIDGKRVSEQVHKFQKLIFNTKIKGIEIPEIVLITSLIKKLPPSWSEFGRSLKHKPESFSLEELYVALRIEDSHRLPKQQLQKSEFQAKAHNVKTNHKPKQKTFKKKGFKRPNGSNSYKSNNNRPKGNNSTQSPCWVCGKTNHRAKDCYHRHGQPSKVPGLYNTPRPQANVVTVGANSNSPTNRYQAQEL